nr:glutathione S-transferase N-terminal domain-containing protein [uncultured Lichenicoccus sp.]
MADGRLVIGTKRYSSWSLRGWLAVQLAGLDVDEQVIPIAGGRTGAIAQATPHGLVPYLEHRGARIWESLAIGEYCAEQATGLWPSDRVARAAARSIASEMHGGFRAIRLAMPMNCGREARPLAAGLSGEVVADIARIEVIWGEAAEPYLYGHVFGIADAMFAPVVSRLLSYAVPLDERAGAYRDRMRAHPLVQRWYDEAALEPASWQLDKYEQVA